MVPGKKKFKWVLRGPIIPPRARAPWTAVLNLVLLLSQELVHLDQKAWNSSERQIQPIQIQWAKLKKNIY